MITGLGSVQGTASPDSAVDIFVDEGDEGGTFLATAVASGDRSFASAVNLSDFVGRNVTATATDASGNTSEFSAPFTIVAGEGEGEGEGS